MVPLGEDLPGVRSGEIAREHRAPRVPLVVSFHLVELRTGKLDLVARAAAGDVALVQLRTKCVLALPDRRSDDGEPAGEAFVSRPLREVAGFIVAAPENVRRSSGRESESQYRERQQAHEESFPCRWPCASRFGAAVRTRTHGWERSLPQRAGLL